MFLSLRHQSSWTRELQIGVYLNEFKWLCFRPQRTPVPKTRCSIATDNFGNKAPAATSEGRNGNLLMHKQSLEIVTRRTLNTQASHAT